MASPHYQIILDKIKTDFGEIKRVGDGYTLYYISSIDAFIYLRYSKLTSRSKSKSAFYGLRADDLLLIQGKKSFICFVWDNELSPLLVPFNYFEQYFLEVEPSKDGQFKTQIFFKDTGTELYLANIGKFNVEMYFGLSALYQISSNNLIIPDFTHSQMQSLIGALGILKGYDIWYPASDKGKIDYSIVNLASVRNALPDYNKDVNNIISEIDVIWLQQTKPISLFEVEHSTPIYSGLLRFNDVLLTVANTDNFNIVADSEREGKFGREINRPTFKQNKLIDKVTFLEYSNIYNWYFNLTNTLYEPKI
jgi:hypothetical protein